MFSFTNAYVLFQCGITTEFLETFREYLFVLIKNNTQTAVINIINLRIDVSYASQHTFSKVTVTIFRQLFIYDSDKGSGTEIKKNNLNSESIKSYTVKIVFS